MICLLICIVGFKDVIGFWKIIEIFLLCNLINLFLGFFVKFFFKNKIFFFLIFFVFFWNNFVIVFVVIDLFEFDLLIIVNVFFLFK